MVCSTRIGKRPSPALTSLLRMLANPDYTLDIRFADNSHEHLRARGVPRIDADELAHMCTGITTGGQVGATAYPDGVPRRAAPGSSGFTTPPPATRYPHRLPHRRPGASTALAHAHRAHHDAKQNVTKPHLGQVEQSSTSTGTGSTTHPPPARTNERRRPRHPHILRPVSPTRPLKPPFPESSPAASRSPAATSPHSRAGTGSRPRSAR